MDVLQGEEAVVKPKVTDGARFVKMVLRGAGDVILVAENPREATLMVKGLKLLVRGEDVRAPAAVHDVPLEKLLVNDVTHVPLPAVKTVQKPKKKVPNAAEFEQSPSAPAPFILRSVSRPHKVHRLREVTLVGRSVRRLRESCDLLLEEEDVSRVHARLVVSPPLDRSSRVTIFDEQSYAGTSVDGEAVPKGTGRGVEVGSYLRFTLYF